MGWTRHVPRSLVLHAGLTCAECSLLRTALRESREEPLKRTSVQPRRRFLQLDSPAGSFGRASERWVDTGDAKTFAWESNLCLLVLTQLNTFVHSSDDVGLGQELVRNELSGSHSSSERGTSSSRFGDPGHVLHVINSPLKRCCTRVVHVIDDVRFLWLQLWQWRHRVLASRTAPSLGDT